MFKTSTLSSEESYDEDETNNNASFKKGLKSKNPLQVASKAIEASDASYASDPSDASAEDVDDVDEVNDETEDEKVEASQHFPLTTITTDTDKKTQMMPKSRKPTTKFMVDKALTELKERKGSSVPSIKKYILENFDDINKDRIGFYIYKYIKTAVVDGKIKQNKMKFKLDIVEKKPKAQKMPKQNAKAIKKVPTKKMATKKTATANTQKGNQEPKKSKTKTNPPKLKGAKAADVLKKTKSKEKSDEMNKATIEPKKSVKKQKSNDDDNASTSKSKQKSTNKKPPTLKIAATAQRKSLSLVKKKQQNAKSENTETINAAKKQPTAETKNSRATRGTEKLATSKK